MRKLLTFAILMCAGCVSTADFVKQNYSPKSGEVQLRYAGVVGPRRAEKKAQELMAQFCAPQVPKVMSREVRPTGHYDIVGNAAIADKRPVISFVCE